MRFSFDNGYNGINFGGFSGYSLQGSKKTVSRLFLALCAYTLISYSIVYLAEFLTILLLGRDQAASVLSSPYYIFALQIVAMYVIALPIFILLCKKTIPKNSFEEGYIVEDSKSGSISLEELIVLFFISVSVMIFGGAVSNLFTDLLSGILGHTVENATSDLIEKTPIWLVILVAVIIGPIVEELIFRKTFIDALGRFGKIYAIIVSSVAFGLFHGNFSQVLYATLLGFILGYIYVKSGKIIYSMIMHILLNFFGTVPTLLLSGSIDRLAEGALDPSNQANSAEYLSDMMNVLGLLFLQYGFAIAGAVLFYYFIFRRRYRLPIEKEIYIPRWDIMSVTFANPGVILFLILITGEFILSIL